MLPSAARRSMLHESAAPTTAREPHHSKKREGARSRDSYEVDVHQLQARLGEWTRAVTYKEQFVVLETNSGAERHWTWGSCEVNR